MYEVWLFSSVIRERATSEMFTLRNTLNEQESRGRVRAVSNRESLDKQI